MLETFDQYSIYDVRKACATLKEAHVAITCDAIKMVLLRNPEEPGVYDGGPDEIELACQRQLTKFGEMRCVV